VNFPQTVHRVSGVTCIALALAGAQALAADPPASPAPTALPEIGRVVTSDRQDEPLRRTARTTYIVTKTEMIARGYVSIADALTTVPGVVVNRYGALGSTATVSIRGSSSAQVLVLLDGRPVAGAQTGTLDLGGLSTSGVERIEIVEGSGATLYGTGAVGGVVNILTTHPARAPLVTLTGGSFDTQAFDVETPYVAVERLVAGNSFDYVGTSVPSGTRIDSDVESTTARLRGGTALGKLRVDGSLGLASQHVGVPGAIALPFSTPAPDPGLSASYQSSTTRQNTTNGDARLTFTLEHKATTTTLDLSGTQQTLLFYSSVGDPLGCYTAAFTQPCADLNQETRLQASLRQVVQTATQRLVYGVDVARGNARIDAGGGQISTSAFAQTAVYAQDSVPIGVVSAYGGLRAERDGGQGGAIAPSVGGIVPLSPALALRTNFAGGFRAPNAVDLYYPGFSNPNLQPERTQAFDVTIADSRLLAGTSLTYFTLAGNNLIVVNRVFDSSKPPGPDNEPVINAQHASIAGLTLDARTAAFHGWTTTLGVTDLYRALDLTSAATRLAGRPVFTASLALEYASPSPRRGIAAFGMIARSVGARSSLPAGGAIDPTQFAAPYTTVDAYLRYRLAPRALLTLRTLNLGNERYSAIASPPFGGYPAPRRAFAAELSTR
jgi:vitamin B12 transporter